VGADDVPTAAAVRRLVHDLAADVDLVVVVRRDREGRVPDESVLDVRRRIPARAERPDLDVLSRARAFVVSYDDAAYASRSGCGRPDEVRIHRVRRRPAALATFHAVPLAARNCRAAPAVARAA